MSDSTISAAGGATAAIMKADHERWLSGLAQWRTDMHRWEAEHRAAIARLTEVQHAIEEHGRCLDEHAIDFVQIEEAVAGHECLTNGEAGEVMGLPDEATIQRHRNQEAAFCRQANAHGRIARHHDAVMECMRALEAAAAAAM
jgi:hypothetical protein